jgi:hypothetical protein
MKPPIRLEHDRCSWRQTAAHFTAGLIPRSLLRKEFFPDLLESVIPECVYRESRRPNLTPD